MLYFAVPIFFFEVTHHNSKAGLTEVVAKDQSETPYQ